MRLRDFVIERSDGPLIEKLSPDHQQILALSVSRDAGNRTPTYEAMAADLDVATGTVRSRLNRARNALVLLRGAPPDPL